MPPKVPKSNGDMPSTSVASPWDRPKPIRDQRLNPERDQRPTNPERPTNQDPEPINNNQIPTEPEKRDPDPDPAPSNDHRLADAENGQKSADPEKDQRPEKPDPEKRDQATSPVAPRRRSSGEDSAAGRTRRRKSDGVGGAADGVGGATALPRRSVLLSADAADNGDGPSRKGSFRVGAIWDWGWLGAIRTAIISNDLRVQY